MARELATLKTKIGHRIKARRVALRLSQEELAFAVDLSTTYLSQIEQGKRNPSLSILFGLSVALKVELSKLVES